MLANHDVIVIAFAAPLLVAGVWDLLWYRIPNVITLLLAAMFVICALIWGIQVDWLSHAGAAGVVLAVGVVLFAFKIFGGGDVKLSAAVALWIGWGADLLAYFLIVALLGGVLAVALLLLRNAITQWGWPVRLPPLPRILQPGAPVPYGVAIVAVALWLTPQASQYIFLR